MSAKPCCVSRLVVMCGDFIVANIEDEYSAFTGWISGNSNTLSL